MAIIYNEKQNIFYLHTKNTSYIFGFLGGNMVHIHWGGKISDISDTSLSVPHCMRPQSAYTDPDNMDIQSDNLPMEFPTYGNTDLRGVAFHVVYNDGTSVTDLKYVSHKIIQGKTELSGLPCTYGDEAETLEVVLFDNVKKLEVTISYSVFEKEDVISRSVKVRNFGKDSADIRKIMSASVDFVGEHFDVISLCGAVLRERNVQRMPLSFGECIFDSKRGASGHQRNPFIALCDKNATEQSGRVYSMALVYSGNFSAGAEVDPYGCVRCSIGINSFDFSWHLESGEEFTSPEALLVYSDEGIGKMSRIYHKICRDNLCRSKYKNMLRPVVMNTWESVHFDFDEEKIIALSKKAKQAGAEIMVIDDGWFGKRDDDTSSLGDWYPNEKKLPGGLSGICEKIKAEGMEMGLWIEPEMISRNSKLFKEHPDWCICTNGRVPSEGRQQLILDLSNRKICDYIINVISEILDSADISYIKWDMNRNMTECGSNFLPPERQRETAHRYMLGLYYILENITGKYPDVLFEGCAAGGGRFDFGMLCYFPQIWTSDNTDASDRVKIQYGTSLLYPVSSMSAHISKTPNINTARHIPMLCGCTVASMGQIGIELNLCEISNEEFDTIKESIERYKTIRNTVHFGDMYRLASPFEGNLSAIEFTSENGGKAVLFVVNDRGVINAPFERVRLCALQKDAIYKDKESGIRYSGEELMEKGIYFKNIFDYTSKIFIFEKE